MPCSIGNETSNAKKSAPQTAARKPPHVFANHKQEIKAAAVVKRLGIRLLPESFAHLNPMPYEAALPMEKDLVEDLSRAGCTVAGGR